MFLWNDIDVDFIRLLFLNIKAPKIADNILPVGANNKAKKGLLIIVEKHVLLDLLIFNVNVRGIYLKNWVRMVPSKDGLLL